jgi:hypothetical protein
MSTSTRCFRHTYWLASCDDCTAWYLPRAIAARDAAARRSAEVLTFVPAGARRPLPALHAA